MRSAIALLAAVLLLVPLSPAYADDPPPEQRRVIVELDSAPAARSGQALAQARGRVAAKEQGVLDAAKAAHIRLTRHRLLTDQVSAIAVSASAADVARLSRLPGVRAVHPDRPMRVSTDVSVPLIGAPEVWKRTGPDGHPARGTGVTVAIIDSGIDYTNPSLGGGFGPGHRVVAGADLVNDDSDPMDDNGHGTHVAGIIAGNGKVNGVAPDATITAYKVMDRLGNGYETDIIAGLQQAIDPANPNRADVVNMSLGGLGDGTDMLGRAATAATEAGVVVVASAGNSGPGIETVGTPAAADGVLAVGASISGLRLPTASVVEPEEEKLQFWRAPYSANPPTEAVTGELVNVGDGTAADYDRVGDVQGKIVAYRADLPTNMKDVDRNMLDAARLAEERGAVALIGYKTGGGGPVLATPSLSVERSGDNFRMDRVVVFGMDPLQWQEIARFLAKGKVRIKISAEDATDQLAAFSSRGPTTRYTLKPDIVAPGVEIRSTWPLRQWAPGEYRLSGTSMAAPHVAGAAALIRQLRPDATVERVRAALMGSAKGLAGSGPAVQGAGRLDVDAAARSTVTASPPAVSMGLADLSRATVTGDGKVTLRNDGSKPVDVTLRADKAGAGTVELSRTQATIPAGGTTDVTVSVSANRPDRDTDLSGWVVAEVSGGAPAVRVPYLLAVRSLVMQTSPDPSPGTGEAFVYVPTEAAAPPVLTITPPHGKPVTVPTTLDHGTWYRAKLDGTQPGVYRVNATATARSGQRLVGAATWEVAAQDHGRAAWAPVGPNAQSGTISTTPADPDVAAIDQVGKAGPWITEDHGATWAQRTRLPVAAGTGDLIIDPKKASRMWYAISGEMAGIPPTRFDPTYQGKVLRSDDSGRTWRTLNFPDVSVAEFVSDPARKALIAVTDDGVLVSRDGGESWESYATGVSAVTHAHVAGQDLYLSTYEGVWAVRGIVGGPPSRTDHVYNGPVYGMVADPDVVAFLDEKHGIRGSRDGGATWQDLTTVQGATGLAMNGGIMMVATYHPYNMISRDHGRTWTQEAEPVSGSLENDVAPWGGNALLLSAGNAGIFRTDPAQRTGVQGRTVYDLAVTSDVAGGPILLAGTDWNVYRTPLPVSNSEWGLSGSEATYGARVPQLAISPSQPGTVWKVRQASGTSEFWVYRSTDGGATWQTRGIDSEVPLDLVVGPTDPNRVVVPFWTLNGVGLYVTRDAGQTWKKLFHDQLFRAAVADPADPDRLWLGSDDGLYRSDDFGATVTRVLSGPVTAVSQIGDRLIAAGESIRWSDDGGRTFHDADTGGLPMRVTALAGSSKALYAATTKFTANGLLKGGRGVLRSTDGGRTWQNISAGLQNLSVESLALSPDGRALYAGTTDGGVHRLDVG